MSMRVHELAKELGTSSKELLAKLRVLGIDAKSHMSALEEAAVAEARRQIGPAPAPQAATPPKAEPPKADAPKAAPEKATPAPKPEKQPEAKKAPEKAAPPPAEPEAQPEPSPTAAPVKKITVRGAVVVKDFADMLGIRPNLLIAELMKHNVLASINQKIEPSVAKQIAEKHGFEFEVEKREKPQSATTRKGGQEEVEEKEDRPEDLMTRPPVVTFLGHVDHGKTSLLDNIRSATVADGESGGITQHIGAYTVDVQGRQITFLDTPGHAAFTAMRARGANMTDIAVIIIAADDGIMPQTREAISHAQAAGVTLMVAINKIDLPGANPDRVRQQLQTEGLQPEDWGGDTICCPVSAQTGEGIDHLLEMILLQSEIMELHANPKRRGRGFVVEAQLEPGMGPTANVLVTNGTLKIGDAVLCGPHWGRIRALINDHGIKIKKAGPSTPVKCLGLSGVPEAGAEFRVLTNDRAARNMAAEAGEKLKLEELEAPRKASLDSLFDQLKENEKLELKTIIKADTQGSVEAIAHSLEEIPSEKVSLNIIMGTTGNVTENDVMLASASDAIILGFHVSKEPGVDRTAKHEGVEIRLHSIIYELIDQVRDAMTGLLAPSLEERVRGRAEVRQVFVVGKRNKVAGCLMVNGHVRPSYKARVLRGDETLFDGGIVSLRHFQDEVAEVREAQECGIRLDKGADFAEGDILEFYEVESIQQSL